MSARVRSSSNSKKKGADAGSTKGATTTIEALQAENAKLRELLEAAAGPTAGRTAGAGADAGGEASIIVHQPQPTGSCSRGQIRSKSREKVPAAFASSSTSAAPSNPCLEPSTLVPRPKEKARYYGEDIRLKTPQEAAEEKQLHAVREAQWQGRQDGGYKATSIVEKPTRTIRNAYEETGSSAGAVPGSNLQIDVGMGPAAGAQPKGPMDSSPKILSEKDVERYRPTRCEGEAKVCVGGVGARRGTSPSSSPNKNDLRGSGTGSGVVVKPIGGENVQIADHKELPSLEQLPTDYMVKGMEVDVSKMPLPLTADEVEARTAMITGVRPHLPGALGFDETLRAQRVQADIETPDGSSVRPVSRGDGRPNSRGPALDYTSTMVEGMYLARERVSSRGGDGNTAFKQGLREKIAGDVGLIYPPEQMAGVGMGRSNARQQGFLPDINGQQQAQQQQQPQAQSFGVVQSGPADNWNGMGPPDTSTWGAYPTTTTTGGSLFTTNANDGMGPLPAQSSSDANANVNAQANTSNKQNNDNNSKFANGSIYPNVPAMEVENAVDVNVPRSNKGVPLELIPVFSEFLTGVMNRKRPDDNTAIHVRDAPPKHWTAPQHPLMVNLLASATPLWKTASTQIYDPNLYLTLFPPPPDKIVVSVVDVVAIYNGAGVMHLGNNTVNSAASTVVVNVREFTELMYELINKYNDAYVPLGAVGEAAEQSQHQQAQASTNGDAKDDGDGEGPVSPTALHPGSVIPHVSRVFEPSSLEWWRKYIKYVLVVRSKPSGQMLAKISKKLVDRLVQTLLISNSIFNTDIDAPFDGVRGIGAGVNTYTHLNGEHQNQQSVRIHNSLWIHSWDFSHVKPVDYAATIHQIGWTNVYGRQETNTASAHGYPATTTATATATAAAAAATAAVEAEPVPALEPAPEPQPKAQSPATNTRVAVDFKQVGLDADNNHHVVALPVGSVSNSGITFENAADELSVSLDGSSVFTTSPGGTTTTKKKKPKNKWSQKKKAPAPANSIPDELLERNARFEINHMMVFNVVTAADETSVGSHGGSLHSGISTGSTSQASLNSTAAKQQTAQRAKIAKKAPGAPMSGTQVVKGAATASEIHVPSHIQPAHINPHAHEHDGVPAGTPSLTQDHHGCTHKIHTFAGSHGDGSDGVIVVHAHHDQTVAERMNSPSARYRIVPGRSSSPGFFGGINQKGEEEDIVGGYWNDNTDVQYEGEPNLRATSDHSNDYPKPEPRPELFLDEAVEKERKRRKKIKADKERRKRAEEGSPEPKGSRREYPTSNEVARRTIVRAREIVSTQTKFRTRKLSEVEAGLFRSPFAVPLVTETMRNRAEALD